MLLSITVVGKKEIKIALPLLPVPSPSHLFSHSQHEYRKWGSKCGISAATIEVCAKNAMYRNKKFPIWQRQLADATRQFVASRPLLIEEIERAMRMGAPEQEFDSGDETFDVVSEDSELLADVEQIIKDNTPVSMSVEVGKVVVDETTSTKTKIETNKPTEIDKSEKGLVVDEPTSTTLTPDTDKQTKEMDLPKIHITRKTLPSANPSPPPPQTLNNTTLDASFLSSSSSLNLTSSTITSATEDSEAARKRREKTKKRNNQRRESKRKEWEGKNAAAEAQDSLKAEVKQLKKLLAAKEGPVCAGIAPAANRTPPKPSGKILSPPDPDAVEARGSAVANGSNRQPRVGEHPRPLMQYDRRYALPPPVNSRPPPAERRPEPFKGTSQGSAQPMVVPQAPRTNPSALPRHPLMGRPQELTTARQDAVSAGILKLEEQPSALQEAAKDFVRIIDGKIMDVHANWKMHQGSADSLKKQLDELHHERKQLNIDNIPNKRIKINNPPTIPNSQREIGLFPPSTLRGRSSTPVRPIDGVQQIAPRPSKDLGEGRYWGKRGRGSWRGRGWRGQKRNYNQIDHTLLLEQENRIHEGRDADGKNTDEEDADATPQ